MFLRTHKEKSGRNGKVDEYAFTGKENQNHQLEADSGKAEEEEEEEEEDGEEGLKYQDAEVIYNTVSQEENKQDGANNDTGTNGDSVDGGTGVATQGAADKKKRQKSKIAYGNEETKTVGNSWSPLNWYYSDKKEKRYHSGEDEEHDKERARAALGTGATQPEQDVEGGEECESAKEADVHEPADEEDTNKGGEPTISSVGGGTGGIATVAASPFDKHPHSYLQQMFSSKNVNNSNSSSGATGNGRKKGRPRFFRSKGKKIVRGERKQSIYCIEDDEEEDTAYFTGVRAQQLVGSLAAGSPAINILASCLLEDEHGIARAPLLLSLLGLKVSDCSQSNNTRNRKFKIELEYGVGQERLRWSVERSASDLLYLHSRFKFDNWRNEVVRNKNSDLPKVPIPPLRNKEKKNYLQHPAIKGEASTPNHIHTQHTSAATTAAAAPSTATIETRGDEDDGNVHSPQGIFHEDDGHSIESDHHSMREQFSNLKTYLSNLSSITENEAMTSRIAKNQEYVVQVARYLNELINNIALKPQSNRLFQFFEILPISSLLSYETGFVGKQGVIHIGGTTRSQGWRVGHFKANDLKGMIDRRSEKWLLIRNSYIMFVSDINSTLPLEVFLVDPKFEIKYKENGKRKTIGQHTGFETEEEDDDEDDDEAAAAVVENYDDLPITQKQIEKDQTSESSKKNKIFKHLKITVTNSERQLVLIPKSYKEQRLWIKSLEEMKKSTVWNEQHRFDSFAPVRENCFAQWFVDARDYFWAISSALEMAKDVIFIHDWWLSPEIYLRRPANGNQQWRLDRILQRKAKQGVKIFVIIYRNVGTTVATDSLYTKHSILLLDEENIHVIRSPNQLLQNTYFWAHHEKLCIVDQTVAFVGGIDLCYGRYDTPDHVIVDDSPNNFHSLNGDDRPTVDDFAKFQVFPGKDYSNPRVKDFFGLDKPYDSMYDRETTPRMPWHDVHMVTLGKVASDLARHFVQRWNYLLRQKRPSRFTPLLIPPPDFTDEEIQDLGLGGTCEVQLLRSSGNWSLGLTEHEQSIQNAYLRLIETSEHFVYIENQFFVTSCVVDGTEIRNRIGDALVDRIIRAHKEGTAWRAVICIPLMPGFESQVDEPEGSSVRVIMQCQFMSISRGATSIFAKLKKYGIEPDDYIQFFSLRKWGIIGPDRNLVTEQLYIHAKTMIVDDRAAIIGSANINERSMRGVRDSEVASLVRDKATVKTTMNGEPYLAGKFAHTLRMRLMREHLGVNVDILETVERKFKKFEVFANTDSGLHSTETRNFKNRENRVLSAMVEIASRDILGCDQGTKLWQRCREAINEDEEKIFDIANLELLKEELAEEDEGPTPLALPISFNNRTGTYEANKGIRDKKKHSYDARVQQSNEHFQDVQGYGSDLYKSKEARRSRLNSAKFLKELAHKSMIQNPTGIFLPNLEEVESFLEDDDAEIIKESSLEESESIIAERNKERWLLLKKISYMQRSAAKEKDQRDEELKKRAKAGLGKFNATSTTNTKVQNGGAGMPHEKLSGEIIENGQNASPAANTSANGNTPPSSQGSNGNRSESSGSQSNGADTINGTSTTDEQAIGMLGADPSFPNDHSTEDVPIVSLDEQGVVDLILSVNPKQYDNFSTFVDPYGFEDPLVDDFYEDLWYEHARRNTEIYRMIFHTQPDDCVPTWKDYKRFSKLQSAFMFAQKQEAKYRQSKTSTEFDDTLSDISSEKSKENEFKYHQRNVSAVKMQDLDQVGLLGQPPQSGGNDPETSSKKKFIRRFSTKDALRDGEDARRGGGEEEEEEETGSGDEEGGAENDTHAGENIVVDGEILPSRKEGSPQSEDSEPKPNEEKGYTKRKAVRRRAGTFSARRKALSGDRVYDRNTAERILTEIQGNLVFFPADWLMNELEGGNWFYNTDRIPPIEIYD